MLLSYRIVFNVLLVLTLLVNSLPYNKILDFPGMKAFAVKLNVAQMIEFAFGKIKTL